MLRLKAVTSIAEVKALDESDVLLGYMSGFDDEPHPGPEATRSFVHGWRNGSLAGGWRAADEDDVALALAFHTLA